MALLPLQRREGGSEGVEGWWRGSRKERERWRQRLFMCNDTIQSLPVKHNLQTVLLKGIFSAGLVSGRRGVSRKTRLDVIDSRGVRACTCARAAGG